MGSSGSGESYRLMLFDRPVGPWRSERGAALNDAIARRLGSRDAWSKVTYLDVGAWIQVGSKPPAPARTATAGAPGFVLREVADLSGRSSGLTIGAEAANDTRQVQAPRGRRMRGRG